MPTRSSIPGLLRLALVSLGILLSPVRGERSASAQAPPTFPAGVELITVDAVVLNALGRPVSGLTRDDFAVFEDGHPQEIVGFEAVSEERAEEAPGPPSAVATNEGEAERRSRAFVILVDDLGIAPPRAEAARQAAASFVGRSARDGDDVTLGTTSGDAWWSARIPEGRADLLAVLGRVKGRYVESNSLDRMTDFEAFWIDHNENSPAHPPLRPDRPAGVPPAPDSYDPNENGASVKERVKRRWHDANLCTGTSCDGMVRDRAADIDAQRKARNRVALEAVRRGLGALAPVRGRKSLLFLAEGLVDDPDLDRRGVVAASREANTAVYFVDVRGLVALSAVGSAGDPEQFTSPRDRTTLAFEDAVLGSAGAQALAEDTGGFSVRNTNDLAAGAERIAAESRVFYLLGLHPLPGRSSRDWRKLRVEVKRPGLTVRARRGYTLEEGPEPVKAAKKKEGKSAALDRSVVRALDSAYDATGIPLRAIAYVFEPVPQGATRVLVAAEFDAGMPLVEKGRGPGGTLDLSMVVTHRDSGNELRFDEVLGLGRLEGGMPGWRAVVREFDLPPGVASVRVVVRDPASGAVGSVSQRFEVPPRGALRLSTPILTDRIEPAASAKARPRPALSAHRVFKPEGGLYLQFEVFGAAQTPEGLPRVSAGLTLRTHDGRLVRNAPPTPIAADSDGRVVRFVGIGLDGLAEGPYDLSLDVRDGVSGDRLEHHEPFTLARETASR